MKQEKQKFHMGHGIRVGLLGLMAVMMLLLGTSCTRDGHDPQESNTMLESSMDNGTVADSQVGSVTSATTERHTTAPGTTAPDTMVPGTQIPGTMVPETVAGTDTSATTSAVTAAPGTTGKMARGGK